MKIGTRNAAMSGLVAATVVGTIALAGNVTLPFSFSAGTTAKASEVNANFAAVKAAVDDSQAQATALAGRVSAVEVRACGYGAARVGGMCVENVTRGGAAFTDASAICVAAGGDLCPQSVVLAVCRDPGTFPGFGSGTFQSEWAQGNPYYREGAQAYFVPGVQLDGSCRWLDQLAFNSAGSSTSSLAFRCCFFR